MKEPKIGDEVVARCGTTRVLRRGTVRPRADRWRLPEDAESFLLTEDLIVVLGDEVPEAPRDEKTSFRGELVLNTDYEMIYLPRLSLHKPKRNRRKER